MRPGAVRGGFRPSKCEVAQRAPAPRATTLGDIFKAKFSTPFEVVVWRWKGFDRPNYYRSASARAGESCLCLVSPPHSKTHPLFADDL